MNHPPYVADTMSRASGFSHKYEKCPMYSLGDFWNLGKREVFWKMMQNGSEILQMHLGPDSFHSHMCSPQLWPAAN